MTNIRSDYIQISIDWCAKTIVQLSRKSFACSSVIDICHNSKLRKKEKKYECLQVNICLVSLHSLLPQILSSVQLVQIGSTDGWECNFHRREFVKQIRAGFWVRMSNNRLLKKIGGYIRFWVFPLRNSITRCPWTSICKRCLKPLRRDGNFLEAFEFLSDNAQITYPLQNVKSKNSIDKLKNSNLFFFQVSTWIKPEHSAWD